MLLTGIIPAMRIRDRLRKAGLDPFLEDCLLSGLRISVSRLPPEPAGLGPNVRSAARRPLLLQ